MQRYINNHPLTAFTFHYMELVLTCIFSGCIQCLYRFYIWIISPFLEIQKFPSNLNENLLLSCESRGYRIYNSLTKVLRPRNILILVHFVVCINIFSNSYLNQNARSTNRIQSRYTYPAIFSILITIEHYNVYFNQTASFVWAFIVLTTCTMYIYIYMYIVQYISTSALLQAVEQ